MKIERNSSFELLRIILIFLILIEHGNLWFIGACHQNEMTRLAQCIIESICIGSVNAFVLISGWFGIQKGVKKIGNIIFILFFTTLPILITALSLGYISINSLKSLENIYKYVLGGNGYWFIVAYIGLAVISPILNSAVDIVPKNLLRNILIISYVLILIYDFVFHTSIMGIEGGYTVGWFGFLYLLAAYMRRYSIPILKQKPITAIICCIVLQSFLFFEGYIGLRYINPLILVEAICIIYIFRRYTFYNKIINFVAGGCLLSYLLHMQPVFIPFIRRFLFNEYISRGYWVYMAEVVFLSMVTIFVSALLNPILLSIYKFCKDKFHKIPKV